MLSFFDFEKNIADLEGQLEELRHLSDIGDIKIADEVSKLQSRIDKALGSTYSKLTAWQKVQVARHPKRPHCVDFIGALVEDFIPLAGDRNFSEDAAIIGGIGRFRGESVVVIGQEKGRDTETRIKHSFGMPKPEGYRKAIRLVGLADKFNLPIVTFVDTPGAYPGIGAEERGQSEAIARSIEKFLSVGQPVVSVVIGEGGSGGAIALATANEVMMMEHSIYSVISPEGCASILWRSSDHAERAAEALKLTAQDLQKFGVIDRIIPEPLGAAHRSPAKAIEAVGGAIAESLRQLIGMEPKQLIRERQEKFLRIGDEALLD